MSAFANAPYAIYREIYARVVPPATVKEPPLPRLLRLLLVHAPCTDITATPSSFVHAVIWTSSMHPEMQP